MQIEVSKRAQRQWLRILVYFIYYVKGEVLRIAAFWDMRMHPDKLRKTI